MRVPHGGQTGLALGVGARIGRVLRVAALELLARVDGGQMSELLLARDLVRLALDDRGHRVLCESLDPWPLTYFLRACSRISTGPLLLRYVATASDPCAVQEDAARLRHCEARSQSKIWHFDGFGTCAKGLLRRVNASDAICNAFKRPTAPGCFLVSYHAASPQRFPGFRRELGAFCRWSAVPSSSSTPSTPRVHACEMARRILVALACIGAAEAGSALAEGTTPLTAANFDDFVEGALAAGKTAMVRFIASEG